MSTRTSPNAPVTTTVVFQLGNYFLKICVINAAPTAPTWDVDLFSLGLLRQHVKKLKITYLGAQVHPKFAAVGGPVLALREMLRQRGCRFHLEGDDDNLSFLTPTDNGGHLRVPLVAAGRLFFFYIRRI